MARGTYISENLTQRQINFMHMLDDKEMDIFSLSELRAVLDDTSSDVNELAENLVRVC